LDYKIPMEEFASVGIFFATIYENSHYYIFVTCIEEYTVLIYSY